MSRAAKVKPSRFAVLFSIQFLPLWVISVFYLYIVICAPSVLNSSFMFLLTFTLFIALGLGIGLPWALSVARFIRKRYGNMDNYLLGKGRLKPVGSGNCFTEESDRG
jgi:hypothetical protein